MATNDIGRVTPRWKGPYDAAEVYELNDIVILGSSVYWHRLNEETAGRGPQDAEVWALVIDGEAADAKAEEAVRAAQEALKAAEEAADTITNAKEGAVAAANTAATDSAAANRAASEAGTYAAQAQTAAETANAANTSAQEAKESAETANNNAQTALASIQALIQTFDARISALEDHALVDSDYIKPTEE